MCFVLVCLHSKFVAVSVTVLYESFGLLLNWYYMLCFQEGGIEEKK